MESLTLILLDHRLSYCTLFSKVVSGFELNRNGQLMTWQNGLKILPSGLPHIGPVKLPVSGPRDPHSKEWLKAVVYIAECLGERRTPRQEFCEHVHNLPATLFYFAPMPLNIKFLGPFGKVIFRRGAGEFVLAILREFLRHRRSLFGTPNRSHWFEGPACKAMGR